jgi:single-strand selective monofunctional uracil DNA glycosylase
MISRHFCSLASTRRHRLIRCMASLSDQLLSAADELRATLRPLTFAAPVTHVYNPLDYAWRGHSAFVRRFGDGPKRVLFLGMNPGPFGMAQTGVPFGEIPAVRDWMGILEAVDRPQHEHPKRPVTGFDCSRSEVSGRRLWGWARDTFGTAGDFFREHFVVNYCPLVWMSESGANLTPDKLPAPSMLPVTAACDAHLAKVIQLLKPEWLVGVGGFAEERFRAVAGNSGARIARIPHPSPANPAANRDWSGAAMKALRDAGVLSR